MAGAAPLPLPGAWIGTAVAASGRRKEVARATATAAGAEGQRPTASNRVIVNIEKKIHLL